MENQDFDNLREEPGFISIPNAGLALLSPWLPRLFLMTGLLNEDRKDFRDTGSRIRAIFMLQYLVGQNKQEYTEQELAFNRVLAGCPFSVPLPTRLELKSEEISVLDSLLNAVKANWTKMQHINMKGFQQSFIERDARGENQEEKWTVTVNERSFDVLLDSVPWQFRLIHYPWLKKPVYIQWR